VTFRIAALCTLILVSSAAAAQAPTAVPALRIDREVGSARELRLEAGQNRLLILSEEIGRIAVANPEIADLKVITPMQVLLTAKGVGSTDLTLWNRANQPLVVALQVSRNLDPLRRQLKELFPSANVGVSSAGELVVLSGEVDDVRLPERIAEVARLHAKQIANLVQVSGNQQVQLEVRFAEVSRGGLRELGVNLFHQDANGHRSAGMFAPGVPPAFLANVPGTSALPGRPPLVPAPAMPTAFSLFFSEAGKYPVSGILNILESNSLAKILAEPTLVTLSGQQARFLAGGELPIPLASTFGQIAVDWKKFGIILSFTPTVIDQDTIHLKLAAEVSDIDPSTSVTIGGTTIPGLISRQSETTVRLGDGQSFAIAGLLSDRVRSTISKLPILGSIPVVGALFRSTSFQRNETELLVVVTAHLARPMAPHEVPPLPTDYEENDPSDFALFLMGSQGHSVEPPARPGAPAEKRGPTGERGYTR
jgi:pilus assembly protein CpaC